MTRHNIDWQDMSELITECLGQNLVDYCYSTQVLNKVINLCKNKNINFVYRIHYTDTVEKEFEYYELIPVFFFESETMKPVFNTNYQINLDDLPKGLGCKVGRFYYGIKDTPIAVRSYRYYKKKKTDAWRNFYAEEMAKKNSETTC